MLPTSAAQRMSPDREGRGRTRVQFEVPHQRRQPDQSTPPNMTFDPGHCLLQVVEYVHTTWARSNGIVERRERGRNGIQRAISHTLLRFLTHGWPDRSSRGDTSSSDGHYGVVRCHLRRSRSISVAAAPSRRLFFASDAIVRVNRVPLIRALARAREEGHVLSVQVLE